MQGANDLICVITTSQVISDTCLFAYPVDSLFTPAAVNLYHDNRVFTPVAVKVQCDSKAVCVITCV